MGTPKPTSAILAEGRGEGTSAKGKVQPEAGKSLVPSWSLATRVAVDTAKIIPCAVCKGAGK